MIVFCYGCRKFVEEGRSSPLLSLLVWKSTGESQKGQEEGNVELHNR